MGGILNGTPPVGATDRDQGETDRDQGATDRDQGETGLQPGLQQSGSCRLQNVNGGHSGTLAFYFCPFWGACRQVTRACRQDYFLWSIFNYTEKS